MQDLQSIHNFLGFSIRFIGIVAFIQSLIFSIHLIFRRKDNKLVTQLLIWLFSIFGVFILGSSMILYANSPILRNIGNLANLTVFIICPVHYLFVTHKHDGSKLVKHSDFWHFLPFVVILSTMLIKMILTDKKMYIYTGYGTFMISSLITQYIIYLILVKEKLRKVGFRAFEIKPEKNTKELKIIRLIMISYLLVLLVKISSFVVWYALSSFGTCILVTGAFFSFSFVLINGLMLALLCYPNLLQVKHKYFHSQISREDTSKYLNLIDQAMSVEKIYLDPLLSMDRLSKKLLISKNHISQIINQQYGLNFNEFINTKRIERAKEMIEEGDTQNILEIAYAVGFNSKSTFNSAFKKITGLTPSEYRQKLSYKMVG